MEKYLDLIAGLVALVYALVAYILHQKGVVDLSGFVATPAAAGTFGLVALGRFYKGLKKDKDKNDE